jgi:Holliday junction DNA helicase RuvA
MFAYLKGILSAVHPTEAIVDVQGVGYRVFIPCRVYNDLPSIGQTLQFFTAYVVREFSHALYGFLSPHERDFFEALISITGIGPKLALSLIGHLTISDLQKAMNAQDVAALCRVPGVGKKTAERLIVELKDKLANLIPPDLSDFATELPRNLHGQKIQDAMLALINLGYNQNTAQKAVKQTLKELPESAALGLIITNALKNI